MYELFDAIGEGLEVFFIFLGMSTPILIISLVYYLKKRLEHKQIMAAIEKGIPFPDLKLKLPKPKGSTWIKNFTAGITLLILAAGFLCFGLFRNHHNGFHHFGFRSSNLVLPLILFAVGISRLIRGLLQRKSEKTPPHPPNQNNSSIPTISGKK